MDLFVYGSLMDEDIMHQVSGEKSTSNKAKLKNFVRKSIKNELYPAMIAEQGAEVEGIIYKNLSVEAVQRLDRFEGDLYQRQRVSISINNEPQSDVFSYIFKPENTDLLNDENWSFEDFIKQGKSKFYNNYFGFNEL